MIDKNVVATAMELLTFLTLQEGNLAATATQTINTTRQGQKTSILLAQSYCDREHPISAKLSDSK